MFTATFSAGGDVAEWGLWGQTALSNQVELMLKAAAVAVLLGRKEVSLVKRVISGIGKSGL